MYKRQEAIFAWVYFIEQEGHNGWKIEADRASAFWRRSAPVNIHRSAPHAWRVRRTSLLFFLGAHQRFASSGEMDQGQKNTPFVVPRRLVWGQPQQTA